MFISLLFYYAYQLSFIVNNVESESVELILPGFYYFLYIFTQFSVNYALFSIPVILIFNNFKKKFVEAKQDLSFLKERIIQIRLDIIKAKINNQNIEEIGSLNLNSYTLSTVKSKLRKLNLSYYADRLNFFLTQKRVYMLDIIFFNLLKLYRKYDDGQEWDDMKNNYITQTIKEELAQIDINSPDDRQYLREKFYKDFDYAITFGLFYESGSEALLTYIYNYNN